MTGDPCRWRLVDRPRLKVQIQLEIRDLWLGLFWRTTKIAFHFYICLVPMVPLHITIAKGKLREEGDLWCSWCHRWVSPEDHQNDHVQYLRIERGKIPMTDQPGRVERFIVGLGPNWVPLFVVIALALAWGFTLWGIWIEFTR